MAIVIVINMVPPESRWYHWKARLVIFALVLVREIRKYMLANLYKTNENL